MYKRQVRILKPLSGHHIYRVNRLHTGADMMMTAIDDYHQAGGFTHALILQQRAVAAHEMEFSIRQRMTVRAQRAQAAVDREQLAVLLPPRIGRCV